MGKVKVTQVRSTIKRPVRQKRTMRALGLTKMHKMVVHEDSPAVRGMIRKVSHLVNIEEINE